MVGLGLLGIDIRLFADNNTYNGNTVNLSACLCPFEIDFDENLIRQAPVYIGKAKELGLNAEQIIKYCGDNV